MIPQQYQNAYAGMFQRPQMPMQGTMPQWGGTPPQRLPIGGPVQAQPVGPAQPALPVNGAAPIRTPSGTPAPYQPIAGRMPYQPQQNPNYLSQMMQRYGGMSL